MNFRLTQKWVIFPGVPKGVKQEINQEVDGWTTRQLMKFQTDKNIMDQKIPLQYICFTKHNLIVAG